MNGKEGNLLPKMSYIFPLATDFRENYNSLSRDMLQLTCTYSYLGPDPDGPVCIDVASINIRGYVGVAVCSIIITCENVGPSYSGVSSVRHSFQPVVLWEQCGLLSSKSSHDLVRSGLVFASIIGVFIFIMFIVFIPL